MTIQEQIVQTARDYGVDENLALQVARAESSFNPGAIGSSGEIGVFQLMPGTASDLGVNPHDVADNIRGGVLYLRQMLGRFGGDIQKALAGYNWGPNAVLQAIATWGESWLNHAPSWTVRYVQGIVSSLPDAVAFARGGSKPTSAPPPSDNTPLLVAGAVLLLVLLLKD